MYNDIPYSAEQAYLTPPEPDEVINRAIWRVQEAKEEKQKIYIASADWMTRNTVHRVEVAAPVENPDLKLRLNEMFITMLSDNVQARELNSSGKYTRLQPGEEAPLNSQEFFYESAYEALESQEKNKTILQ